MDDYPSNSHRERTPDEAVDDIRASQKRPATKRLEGPKIREKEKLQQITEGVVVRRKPPLGKRLRETFIGGDSKSVWGYVVMAVLIPAVKDMMSDAISQGVDRTLFGDSRPRSRRGGSRGGSSYGHVAYNRMSSPNTPYWGDRSPEPRREMSQRARSSHDFDDIVLESRGEAEEVIDRLFDLVSKYDVATVSDLYELTGITGNFTDEKWGWTDLKGANITRVRGGYLLNLPRPEPLD